MGMHSVFCFVVVHVSFVPWVVAGGHQEPLVRALVLSGERVLIYSRDRTALCELTHREVDLNVNLRLLSRS